jgi:hypothetical protein
MSAAPDTIVLIHGLYLDPRSSWRAAAPVAQEVTEGPAAAAEPA